MKTTDVFRKVALAIAVVSLAVSGHAASAPSLKRGDKSFLEAAAKAGMEEVAVSQAALPHLTNAEVKQFATMMVSDHSGSNQELATLAARKGVTLPTKQPDTMKWEKTNEKDYDAEYVEKMVKDHAHVVELFAKAAKKSDDPEVQAFAEKTLPALQGHLAKAKDLKKTDK